MLYCVRKDEINPRDLGLGKMEENREDLGPGKMEENREDLGLTEEKMSL